MGLAWNYQTVSRDTVWEIGVGLESGPREQPRRGEGSPIGCFLSPKTHAREAFGYFPNSLSRHLGE